MHLIHDDVGDCRELSIRGQAAQQDACGAEQQLCGPGAGCVQSHMVPAGDLRLSAGPEYNPPQQKLEPGVNPRVEHPSRASILNTAAIHGAGDARLLAEPREAQQE